MQTIARKRLRSLIAAKITFVAAAALTLLLLVVSFYPFVWMFMNAFKSNREIFANPLTIPATIDFAVFGAVWKTGKLALAFYNSILVSTVAVLSIVLMSSLAAFALSHMKFRGQRFLLALIVGAQVVSGQVLLIPLFKLFTETNLIGSVSSVILVYIGTGLPLSVFLFWGFFRGISPSIYESTKMDGCPDRTYYRAILMPLSAPIIGSVIVFQMLFCWNEYLFALTFLKDNSSHTIPIQLQLFSSQFLTNWAYLFAALTISVFPILVVYILLQRFFIKGLTAGAVKG